jgi:hypothetical protein
MERAKYSTTGAEGNSPNPSQRCVAAIHDTGMTTATRANSVDTPNKRSRTTSTLSDFVIAGIITIFGYRCLLGHNG